MRTLSIASILRLLIVSGVLISGSANAGNPDRAGQAGATEVLINPWARSSGWANANCGSIRGLEAAYLNVAGIAQIGRAHV